MKKEIVKDIIIRNNLISGSLSRQILTAIIKKNDIDSSILPKHITQQQIAWLKVAYENKLIELGIQNIPRYLPFYHIIKDKMPSFSWVKEESHGKQNVNFNSLKISKVRPSLLSLLLMQDCPDNVYLMNKYSCVSELPFDFIQKLDILMKKIDAYYPSEGEMVKIINLLKAGMSKKKITIFTPLCPDYATELTGDSKCPIRYTFDFLGENNGIIGEWIAKTIPFLIETLKQFNFEIEVVVAMADFEAFSEENLNRFKVTKEKFIKNLRSSAKAFIKDCSADLNVIMFSELCHETLWNKNLDEMRHRLFKRDFGFSGIDSKKLLQITKNRKALYKQWHGERNAIENYVEVTLAQGACYAVMGKVLAEKYENCLIFAADNKVMRYFYSVESPLPTLYLNRSYC